MSELRDKTAKGILWQFSERIAAEAVTLIVSIVLARLLLPEHYGTIAMIQVFISFSTVFITSGFSAALIQKKNADKVDFYSALYSSIILGIIIYAILFVVAPYISNFYNNSELTGVLRVLALQIPILSVKSIEQAYLTKKFEFKKFFYATIIGTVLSAAVGIIMAYHGFGVWSLCAQSLSNYTIDTIALAVLIGKPIELIFSTKRIKKLLEFSVKMLVAGLINAFYMNLKNLIIGKVYSSKDLSYFNKGEQFPKLIASNISTTIETVFFPTLSHEQDNIQSVKNITKRFVGVSTYLMFPVLLGLAAIANTLIPLLLTDKWAGCIIYLQMFCVAYMFNPMQIATIQPIKALGKAGIYLKAEIIRKSVGIIVIISVMNFGVFAIGIATIALSVFNWIVNSITASRIYQYGVWEQIKDFLSNFIISIVMGAAVYISNWLPWHPIIVLVIQVIGGISLYLILSLFSHNISFNYLLKYAKEMIRSRK